MDLINSLNLWLNLTRLAIILLTIFLGWATYRSHMLLKEFQPDFNLLLTPPELATRVVLVGICFLLAWLSGLPAAQLGFTTAAPLRSIGLGLGLGISSQIVINFLTNWAIKHFGRQIYSPLLVRNILPRRPGEWILIALAMLPAVAMEELLFRTLWLGGFSQVMPPLLLIAGTSIIFGLMHQPQGQLGMITAGGINVLFSLLFIGSGELLIPFIAHYTINILQLIVAHYQRDWLENY